MNRILLSTLLALLLLLGFSQQKSQPGHSYRQDYAAADRIYHQAGQLSSISNYTEETATKEAALNRQALKNFRDILPAVEKALDDSLAFHCYYKIGELQHYFDSIEPAKRNYAKAIALKSKIPSLPDSFLFKPHIFLGGIQYSSNQFDSALFNYKRAEAIASRYSVPLDGTNRLYNTLGAMYFETGNYSQAKNYFEKAIALLGSPNSSTDGLRANYEINLAATLTKLENYDAANTIYQQLLREDINKNDILHNLGAINLALGAGRKAIGFFKQVRYNNNKIVRLLNDIGLAYESLNMADSAQYYYQEVLAENKKWNVGRKNIQAGLALKHLGDMAIQKDKFTEALEQYQLSVIQFVNDFNERDIYKNPEQFSGVFSYINLFNALTAKADAFVFLYRQEKDISQLKAALDAYRAAFKLADFVERTYDSDEARLFLNKIKYTAHSKPIDISLLLHELTGEKQFLEEAYFFDQRNKASILSLNVQENKLKDAGNDLTRQEALLRISITRMSLKAANITDSVQLAGINAAIRDDEIRLGKIQEQINADPVYRDKQAAERIPSVNELSKLLDNSTTLLSYHLSEKEILVLVISSNGINYHRAPVAEDFYKQLAGFKTALHSVDGLKRFEGRAEAAILYAILIKPVEQQLAAAKRLIIIPDDELNYLPFEALQDEQGKYLLEKFAVQYQYSTALLRKHETATGKLNGTLAFAPFTTEGYEDSTGFSFTKLPASKQEVSQLPGTIFTGSNATKANFLTTANHNGIIHLATHATVNNEFPLRSFIAFYPVNVEYRLYAQEIYDMKLDSTQLIILSACETGAGQLVKGEGLMSLSRAFAYAGCPNIITSLWKAEDKTTAFITRQLHHYIDNGFSKDVALQQAKLDLLKNKEIDPRFKTPNYWAHLLFIGDYQPNNHPKAWWWIAAGIIVLTTVYLFIKHKKKSRA
jgi:CHAT domain-containing protein/tetratricopeptide (TPR) repeat protein